jgi:hypothetical protein
MKESSTYQMILEDGRLEGETATAVAEAKKVLRILGDDAFGVADARTAERIERLDDLPRLEELLKRLHSAGSGQELFGMKTPPRRASKH